MADTQAAELDKCNEEVPLLGVTREFDFGQFIELFDSTEDPLAPNLPTIARVVIQPNSTLAADRNAATSAPPAQAASNAQAATAAPKMKMVKAASPAPAPEIRPPVTGAPEVDLFALTENGISAKRPVAPIEIKDVETFLKNGTVEYGGETYKVPVQDSMREGLSKGLSFTLQGVPLKGGGKNSFQIYQAFHGVNLSAATMAQALAGNNLDALGGVKPYLTVGAVRSLLSGAPVLTHGVNGEGKITPLALFPPLSVPEPKAGAFQLFDVPSFLANPVLPAKDGGFMTVDLTGPDVEKLLATGHVPLTVGGKPVEISVVKDHASPEYKEFATIAGQLVELGQPALKPFGEPWVVMPEIPPKLAKDPHFSHPLYPGQDSGVGPVRGPGGTPASGVTVVGGNGGPQPATVLNMTDKVQPRLPTGSGLPIAVFVPWKQTWTLKGFSRGNLLSSIALAPSEQVTMQVSSWERRSRTLEQSSETEVDQQTDINQSTRDTEDVFKEMLAKRDFAWQLSGSVDASYSPGVASIKVHLGGGVSETDSIQQTARNSSQSVKESTIKASSRVRSKRVTRVTQSVESGKEERVTRVIRNPNQCHTLTLDFFETLSHYEIALKFMKDRLRLVVLVPNPVKTPDFDSATVRRNETALRNSLIDEALADGFEACRLAAAYDEAKILVNAQKAAATKVDAIDTDRPEAPAANVPAPATPQEAEVIRVVTEMVNALRSVRQDAGIDAALTNIRFGWPVPEALRKKGQQWLFINFCASKFPALLSVLDELVGGTTVGIAAAQKIMAVLPRPDAPVNLGNLNQMSDAEKEGAGLASKLKELNSQGQRRFMQMDWDWGWWTGRLKEEGLYSANDGGVGGGADQLQKAYTAWEAKKAQGDAMKDQDVAKTEAEGQQDKASTEDKLSMAFPLEDLARAYERMKVLFAHLNEHKDFYNYALFQAMPPSEQVLKIVEASNGRLQVGLFEPRVVAMSGTRLVVPLTPLAGSPELRAFVTGLANDLDQAFTSALALPDNTILPTPGVSVSSRLGKCTGCEDFIEDSRRLELVRLEALAQQEQAEVSRRKARLDARDFGDFRSPAAAVKLELENKTPA